MSQLSDILKNFVPISDFSRGKAAQIFDKASGKTPVIVMRNNVPTAVILSIEEYKRLAEAEENLRLLSLTLEHSESDKSRAS